jgi:hypothetical protein
MRAVLPLLLLNVRPVPYAGAPRLSVPPLTPPSLSAPALSPSLTPSLIPLSAPQSSPLPSPLPAPEPAKPASDAPAERQSAEAARRFDGSLPVPAGEPVLVGPVESYRAAKPEDGEWVESVMAALRGSRTGRRVLADVEDLARRRGRPVIVDVARISNNAEVRYDSGLLVMDRNHRRKDPALAAPIMAHELQHVLQKADGLPVDALELEIESYTVEARVWDELGLKPAPRSFARMAKTRLQRDPDAFFVWLAGEYDKNRLLHGSTMESYVEWLKLQREKSQKKIRRYRRRIAEAERVMQTMSEAKMPAKQVDAHRHDELLPAQADLRGEELALAWIERDLAQLSTEQRREHFRAYSRGVIRRARAMKLEP